MKIRTSPLGLFVACSLAFGLVSCSTAASAQRAPQSYSPQPIHLTLVGTNDWHGWVKPHVSKLPDGRTLNEGGIAVFASYVSILRHENPGGVLLLDAGDLFQGTLVSNMTEGAVVIDAFNQLGFLAAAIGNHEFDYGPVGPVSVASDPGMDPFGALKARIAQARFPLLSVNLYDAKTGERPGWLNNDGTMLTEVKGIKVGILGLTTPTTPQTTNPVNVASLRFGSLAPETRAAAKKLRDQGAEVVIAVAHAGGKCGSYADPRDLSSCDQQTSEIFEMLDELPPGTVDAVIAGHTHAPLGHFINGTPVIENWGLGKAFGVIDLYVDAVGHHVIPSRTRIEPDISICEREDSVTQRCDAVFLSHAERPIDLVPTVFHGHPVHPDPVMKAILAPAYAQVQAEQQRRLGIEVPRRLGRNYESESDLGSLLADTLRQMERADVALLNSGGLRADLPAGDLTYGDIYEVLPFDNSIATLTVTGQELRRLLQQAYGARKGVFQVSGVKVRLARCPGQGRLKAITLADGRAIDPYATYHVVLPDFLARGGDGLGPVISTLQPNQVELGLKRPLSFRDQLIAYWQHHDRKLVAPAAGRMAFVDDGASCAVGAKYNVPVP